MRIAILFLAVWVLTASRSWAWGEDSALAAAVVENTHSIFGGMIKSVSWADPAKEIKSEIVVVDPARKTTHIVIAPTTTLWGADDKAIMPDKILPKAHVNVIYSTTPEGINIGKSIKLLR